MCFSLGILHGLDDSFDKLQIESLVDLGAEFQHFVQVLIVLLIDLFVSLGELNDFLP